jgi:hypothetical protein
LEDQLNLQSMNALLYANKIRLARAEDKRQIARGRKDAAAILRDVPKHWETAKVVELLLCLHRVGRVKAQKWCGHAHVELSRPLRALSPRQRHLLASHVDVWAGRRDEVRRDLERAA